MVAEPLRTPKKLSPNANRRAAARDEEKRARIRERLARLEAGGEPSRPIDVPSASVVEVQARALPCPSCLGACWVEEHAAEKLGDRRLRVAHVRCGGCGRARSIYFRIVATGPN